MTENQTEVQKELTPQELAAKKLQLMSFYKENSKFLAVKKDYQKLVTEQLELEARELKARIEIVIYSEKLAKLQQGEVNTKVTLTQKDIDDNKELSENGFQVGDVIDISIPLKDQIKQEQKESKPENY